MPALHAALLIAGFAASLTCCLLSAYRQGPRTRSSCFLLFATSLGASVPIFVLHGARPQWPAHLELLLVPLACVFLLWVDLLVALLIVAPAVLCAAVSWGVLSLLEAQSSAPLIPWLVLGLVLAESLTLWVFRPFAKGKALQGAVHRGFLLALVLSATLLLTGRYWAVALSLLDGLGLGWVLHLTLVPSLSGHLLDRAPERASQTPVPSATKAHLRQTLRRFSRQLPHIRFGAWGKLAFDPMFSQLLATVVPQQGRLLDVGCGWGLVDAWILTAYPKLQITGCEVLRDRVLMAQHLLGSQVQLHQADITKLVQSQLPPWAQGPYDCVLCLDVLHHIEQLAPVLAWMLMSLRPGGRLVLRSAVRPEKEKEHWEHRLERAVVRARGQRVHQYRSLRELTKMLELTGFERLYVQPGPNGRAETLIVAFRPNPAMRKPGSSPPRFEA